MPRKRKQNTTRKLAVPEKYASFYEAWPKVKELRRFTTQQGMPRIGLEGEDLAKAYELIRKYKDG